LNVKHSRAQVAIIVFLAILLFGVISALVVHSVYSGPSVSSGWEFAGWQYRKEHNVTTSAGDQTDYPVNLIVHYGGNEIGEWVTKAPMPYALADVATATYDGQIYVFGGYGTDSSDVKNYTLRYDPSSDTWTRMADMPTPRWGIAAAEYNGIIYVFAGTPDGNFLHGTAETDAYNVTSNSWQTMNDVPSGIARVGLMAVTVGNEIYLLFANYTYAFDSTANSGLGSFTQEADAPMNRSWATCAYVNVGGQDRIYLIGGFDWVTSLGSAANYYYDVAGNVWSSARTAAPYAAYGTLRENPVNGGLIYYGFGRNSEFYNYLYAYNASEDSWSSLLANASYKRDGLGCAFVDGNLYAIGGRDVNDNP
jgi:N-acetylneuraminic acid mutarotase